MKVDLLIADATGKKAYRPVVEEGITWSTAVSYTHLDVYKRQIKRRKRYEEKNISHYFIMLGRNDLSLIHI